MASLEQSERAWHGMPLIPGEKIITGLEKDISYQSFVGLGLPRNGQIAGKLLITNYKLYFYGSSVNKKNSQFSVELPLCTISRIEKVGGTSTSRGNDSKNVYGFDIYCKDLRILHFIMKHENKQRKPLLEKLQKLCFPMSNGLPFFAYNYEETFDNELDGWNVYNPKQEFSRQGLPNNEWRFTDANVNYELCDTYPQFLVVPSSATDDDLKQVAQFRSRSRIPVLSWIHRENKATITRCSQPQVGFSSNRSKDDENYLTLILKTNKNNIKLPIFDARPQANAIANLARGGGYEKSEPYPNCNLLFCDIQNIHVMRDSLKKFQEACAFSSIDPKHWYVTIDQSQWLHHAKNIIAAATGIADQVENEKTSVLVHCSDGWDRTAQMTALSMIMLDSYYRTLKGFQVLIEKEWLSFGHKFAQRIGHGDKNHSNSERSPVFLQFIDCVWQLTQQFPNAFEFNEDFLILILDHLYSCLFGNFLYNCERERSNEKVKEKCKSLWSLVNAIRGRYMNPLYTSMCEGRVILPVVSIRNFKVWKAYFGRWNPKLNVQEESLKHHQQLVHIRDQLRERVSGLESKLAAKKLLDETNVKSNLKVAEV